MATSGTIGATVIITDKVIEHAIRRVGLSPTSITHETLEIARENLYLLLLALANRGLNLWCVTYDLIGLTPFKATYQLPTGTVNLLEMYYSTPSRSAGIDTNTATSFTTELTDETRIIRLGLKFDVISASETITFQSSPDGIVWTTLTTFARADWQAGRWYWQRLDFAAQARWFRITSTAPITVDQFYLTNSVFELKIAQYSRDEYFSLPNRQIAGKPSTNYYYERLVPEPQVTLWPVPNNEFDQLSVVYHRQVQDIGLLTQEIELPERWREAIIWQLAERLAFELPGIDPARAQAVQAKAAEHYAEVGMEETDGANIRISPMISGYTR